MFPDPKKMFGPSDEDRRKAYDKGARDSRDTGAGGHIFHDFMDTVGKFVPDNRNSADKSYEAGWHDNENGDYEPENRDYGASSSGGGDYSSGNPRMYNFIMGSIGLIFLSIVVFSVIITIAGVELSSFAPKRNYPEQSVWTMGMVNTLKLNVRSNPGTSSSVIAQFEKGSRMAFTGEPVNIDGSLWIKVSTPDGKIQGWANRKYISP